MRKKRIMVTGGAGFIGSTLIRKLNEFDEKIILVDKLGTGSKCDNILDLDFDTLLNDYDSALDYVKKCKFVIHLGATLGTNTTDNDQLIENNYNYSKRLIKQATLNNVPIIYASSVSVYSSDVFREDIRPKPLNVYGLSKALIDRYVLEDVAVKKPDSIVTGMRLFNVYGENEASKGDSASMVYKLVKSAYENNTMEIFNNAADIFRDYVYVHDVVKVIIHFIEHPIFGIYNVGSGEAISITKLASLIYDKINAIKKQRVETIVKQMPPQLSGKMLYYTCADLNMLRGTGYDISFTKVDEGLNKLINFFKEKTDGQRKR